MVETALLWISAALLALLFWQGEFPERLCVTILVMAIPGTSLVDGFVWHQVRWAVAILDATLFVIWAAISLRFNRYWLIALAGYQLIIVLTHFVPLLRSDFLISTAVTVRLGVWLATMVTLLFALVEIRAVKRFRLREAMYGHEIF